MLRLLASTRVSRLILLFVFLAPILFVTVDVVLMKKTYTAFALKRRSPQKSKQFVYLIQTDKLDPFAETLQTNENRDVFWLIWRNLSLSETSSRVGEANSNVLYAPGLSWTEGRNALLDFALRSLSVQLDRHLVAQRPNGYLYYVFMDEDIIEQSEFTDLNWQAFESWLASENPAVGFIVGSTAWHHPNRGFNVDANINAFRYTTIGTLIPYDTTLDSQGIYFSQYTQNMFVAALYATDRRYWPEHTSVFSHTKNFHTKSVKYKRSKEWKIVKQHLSSLWIEKGCFERSFDIVNCGSTSNDEYCEYDPNNFRNAAASTLCAQCGPVDESWVLETMNASHPLAVDKLRFLRKHRRVLRAMRNLGSYIRCKGDATFNSLSCA